MQQRKLDSAALEELAKLYKQWMGFPSADPRAIIFRRARFGLKTEDLRANGWDEQQLHKAGLISHGREQPRFEKPFAPRARIWCPHGPLYALLFNEQPKLSGVFTEVPHEGPSGWRFDDSEKNKKFLASLRHWTEKRKALRKAAMAIKHPYTDRKTGKEYLKCCDAERRAQMQFRIQYSGEMRALWHEVPWDNPTGRPIPFFNAFIIPRSPAGKKFFWDLVTLVADLYATEKGRSVGGPKETRAIDAEEQHLAAKMRKQGKGTEKGSLEIISSEIGLEKRNLSDRAWKRKRGSIRKSVQRHFKRHGL